ncbi:MAG: DUF4411 family protein [Lachnospiraceae bacterium]|nr:DUF4411 family protein [Lachnospiraceae bacterium]
MIEEKFLLDSNSFMTPYQNYYPFDLAPGFWKQMKPKLACHSVAVLDVVKDEILKGNDELTVWLEEIHDLNVIDKRDIQIVQKYAQVLKYVQDSPLYTDKALRMWSNVSIADPWLIATASVYGYKIVTFETGAGKISTPSGKPKIPDIARQFDVNCVNLFYFMRKMGFQLK